MNSASEHCLRGKSFCRISKRDLAAKELGKGPKNWCFSVLVGLERCSFKTWPFLLRVNHDRKKIFIVFEEDVVFRVVLFDEGIFKKESFFFCSSYTTIASIEPISFLEIGDHLSCVSAP